MQECNIYRKTELYQFAQRVLLLPRKRITTSHMARSMATKPVRTPGFFFVGMEDRHTAKLTKMSVKGWMNLLVGGQQPSNKKRYTGYRYATSDVITQHR